MDHTKLFHISRSKWTSMEEYCGFSSAALMQVVKSVASNEEIPMEERLEKLQKLKQCGERIAKLSVMVKCRGTVAKQLFDAARDEALEPEKIRDIYKRGLTSAKRKTHKATAADDLELKNIDIMIQKITGTTDNDIMEDITSQQAPSLCPILKCALENPMKNSACGHVYSLKGVIQLFMQTSAPSGRAIPATLAEVPANASVQCPQFGCNVRLKPSTLKRDFGTELTQRQQQSASLQAEPMDVEEI